MSFVSVNKTTSVNTDNILFMEIVTERNKAGEMVEALRLTFMFGLTITLFEAEGSKSLLTIQQQIVGSQLKAR